MGGQSQRQFEIPEEFNHPPYTQLPFDIIHRWLEGLDDEETARRKAQEQQRETRLRVAIKKEPVDDSNDWHLLTTRDDEEELDRQIKREEAQFEVAASDETKNPPAVQMGRPARDAVNYPSPQQRRSNMAEASGGPRAVDGIEVVGEVIPVARKRPAAQLRPRTSYSPTPPPGKKRKRRKKMNW